MRLASSKLQLAYLYLSASSIQSFRPVVARSKAHLYTVRNMASSSSPTEDQHEGKSWRSLLEASSARSRKIRGSNYVQIATVDPETLEPRCRTVVFRGFQILSDDHAVAVPKCDDDDALPCILRMITDTRSEKVTQITKHSTQVAELLWWFPKSSEQYRVRGELLFVGGSDDGKFAHDEELQQARKQQWGNLSDPAREAFFDPEIPGKSCSSAVSAKPDIPAGGRDEHGKVLPPPNTFLLMLLRPKHIDYLRLTNQYRQVDQLEGSDKWTSECVNP